MQAIILAAGLGKRLGLLNKDLPKAFISIEKTPIIKHSLNCLIKAGIKNVIFVVGFKESFFKQSLNYNYNGITIEYISNPQYETSGSMYSLSKTRGRINNDIVLLESDLLYECRAIKELKMFSYPDTILVSKPTGSNDEVFVNIDNMGFLKGLGKSLPNREKNNGEFVGITKLSKNFLEDVYTQAEKDYSQGLMRRHYEEVIMDVANYKRMKCLYIEDLRWTEIDKPRDLEKARNIIFPAIKRVEN
tara:strand:- start:20800 stop:21537 length:738 start_codon:yes stop_codon:yes gene_type:complete